MSLGGANGIIIWSERLFSGGSTKLSPSSNKLSAITTTMWIKVPFVVEMVKQHEDLWLSALPGEI